MLLMARGIGRRKNSIAVPFFLVIFSLAMLCGFQKGRGLPTPAEERPVPVKAMRVALRDLTRTLDYVGDVKARDEAFVYPKTSGKVAEKIKEEGAKVEKGEALVCLDRDETGYQFEKAPVESPLTGVLGRVLVDVGASVTPQTPVAFVVDMDEVKIIIHVAESQLAEISVGQKAQVMVDAYPDAEFEGFVAKISPVLDPASRTAAVEVAVANQDHRLKSGMYARIKIAVAERKKMPAVLKEAVIGRGENQWVYVVEAVSAVRKKIVPDFVDEPYVGLKEGLRDGELVVVVGHQKLYDGAKVAVEMLE